MNYHALFQSGDLLARVREAYQRLSACDLCPHECGVNRIKGELGVCSAGLKPKIASANVHYGEEPPISGTKGSGTVFMSGCSLKCVFCQNYPISQFCNGEAVSTKELASRMLKLQRQGVHNINFVTPTHFIAQILAALWIAIPQGFKLPIVWNSSGYEKIDVLQLLDGIVSIYLPDMKYSDDSIAIQLSSAPGYSSTNHTAVREMLRQVGHLSLDENGIAASGLIIRHLVLPEGKAGTGETLKWIAENLGRETHIALMNQYFPAHLAHHSTGMHRKVTEEEYDQAVEILQICDLDNGWVQENG